MKTAKSATERMRLLAPRTVAELNVIERALMMFYEELRNDTILTRAGLS